MFSYSGWRSKALGLKVHCPVRPYALQLKASKFRNQAQELSTYGEGFAHMRIASQRCDWAVWQSRRSFVFEAHVANVQLVSPCLNVSLGYVAFWDVLQSLLVTIVSISEAPNPKAQTVKFPTISRHGRHDLGGGGGGEHIQALRHSFLLWELSPNSLNPVPFLLQLESSQAAHQCPNTGRRCI